MKRLLCLALALLTTISLMGCGGSQPESEPSVEKVTEPAETEADLSAFPIVGMWQVDDGGEAFWRIYEGGELSFESVSRSTSTSTFNGVTTSSSSASIMRDSGTWEIRDNTFMFNCKAPYEMVVEGDDYKLVGAHTTYVRIGDVDYEIDTGSASDKKPGSANDFENAVLYELNTPLVVPGVEIVLTECGFSEDIRITSKSSGITMTCGPSVDPNKTYFYLKGTLKNTGKQATFPAIGGAVAIDGYEYKTRVDTITKQASPSSMVEPLDEVYVLIYAHIPNELANSFTEGKMVFGFNDGLTNVDITDCDYLYYVDAVK